MRYRSFLAESVSAKVSSEGPEAVIHVEDNGCGIAPDLLPRIFDMFTQADDAMGTRQDGLGLGLSIVKEIVSLHGGTVQVRSDGIGMGAELTVRIPAIADGTVPDGPDWASGAGQMRSRILPRPPSPRDWSCP